MKLLFACNHLWNYTGSELNLLGLARAMAARGHEIVCYAQFVTPLMRSAMADLGLRVLQDLEGELDRFAPDAIFCQHHPVASILRSRLPTPPMLLAHLGVEPEIEQAPLLDCGASLHLAISEEMRGALIAQEVPAEKIVIFRNAIDIWADEPTSGPAFKHGAVLFSYKISASYAALVTRVAAEFGMTLDSTSLTQRGDRTPQGVIARLRTAQLVFASGRGALEAALAGAAVVVLGPKGLDGALTVDTWASLAQANFSGRRHAIAPTEDAVRRSIKEALSADGEETSRVLARQFGLPGRAEELERLLLSASRPAMSPRDTSLNCRMARVLAEQRQMAMYQGELLAQAKWNAPRDWSMSLFEHTAMIERDLGAWAQRRPRLRKVIRWLLRRQDSRR